MSHIVLPLTGQVERNLHEVVFTVWHFNGVDLTSNLEPLRKQFLEIRQNLKINNAIILDSGTYEASLVVDPFTYLVTRKGCPISYSGYVQEILGNEPVILAQTEAQLEYDGKG